MKKISKVKFAAVIMAVIMLITSVPAYASTKTVKLSRTKVTITYGQSYQLKLVNTKKTPKWSSANTRVVKVSSTGRLTTTGTGTTKVYAKLNNKKYACTVAVNPKRPKVTQDPTPAGFPTTISSNIRRQAPQANVSLLNAFEKLHFQLKYDSSAQAGLCDIKNQRITLREQSTVIYHELGHLLSFLCKNADSTVEFRNIFNAEKSKFTKVNKVYCCASASEYFAESYKNYLLDRKEIRTARPQTYAYIQKCIQQVNQLDKANTWDSMYRAYKGAGIWK